MDSAGGAWPCGSTFACIQKACMHTFIQCVLYSDPFLPACVHTQQSLNFLIRMLADRLKCVEEVVVITVLHLIIW